ncbi:glycosyltransferase family 4 protein [Chryseobacterium sp. CT-SW4]|uniref:glycosyltransferase family 4 protein n=1 Tax=Chryseobacterium sp. SW-1 TaxID=3157343 RepID=UPI003B0257A8
MKIVCLYQVIMHYRLPFYTKMSEDSELEFTLVYGHGKKGTKLVNTNTEYVKFNHIKLKDYRIPLPFSPKLLSTLIKLNPDIVFSEGSSSLINSSIAFLYAKVFKKKFIWWSLGSLKDDKKKGIRKLISHWENVIERSSDAIFTYSSQGQNHFIERGVKREKIFVGVNVFDTSLKLKEIEETFEEGYISKNSFNIVFIGTIQKTKNLELLIDVIQKMNSTHGKDCVKLHIIGDGEYLDIVKKYSNGSDAVIFYGRINSGSSKIVKNSDVMVLPGLGGLAIVEGMLNSLPIITGYADGTELDLVDETNGAIIQDMNFQNLYDKLDYYYRNRDSLKELGNNSFHKITTKYSFENYYEVFKKMINFVNN